MLFVREKRKGRKKYEIYPCEINIYFIFLTIKSFAPSASLRLCVKNILCLFDSVVADLGDHVFSFTFRQSQDEFVIQRFP